MGGGCLLYGLMKGDAMPIGEVHSSHRLGPLTIRWRVENADREPMLAQKLAVQGEWPAAQRLYATSLVFPHVGNWILELVTPAGTVLATAAFAVEDAEPHPWMPLGFPGKATDEVAPAEKGIDAVGRFGTAPRPPAVPAHQGMTPFREGLRPKQVDGTPLPPLIPREEGLKLERDAGGSFLVTASEDIILSHPHTRFLCRWWVGDEPFVPEVRELANMALTGRIIEGRTLRLGCDFDPAHLSAKRGDEISLRLLYCREGWRYSATEAETLAILRDDGGPASLLSNRVTFTAP